MVALLQPPPLLTMGIVLLLAAAAMWAGLRWRPARDLDRRAETTGTKDHAQSDAATEQTTAWGTPDPAPPARTPFSYDRLVIAARVAPEVDPAEPVAAQPLAEASETSPEPEMADSPAAAQPAHLERPPEHVEHTPEQEREISLAEIFTRAQRRRDEE